MEEILKQLFMASAAGNLAKGPKPDASRYSPRQFKAPGEEFGSHGGQPVGELRVDSPDEFSRAEAIANRLGSGPVPASAYVGLSPESMAWALQQGTREAHIAQLDRENYLAAKAAGAPLAPEQVVISAEDAARAEAATPRVITREEANAAERLDTTPEQQFGKMLDFKNEDPSKFYRGHQGEGIDVLMRRLAGTQQAERARYMGMWDPSLVYGPSI